MAGKKLLVADDSLTIQKVIRLALSNEGYDIQAVSDGKDATEQLSLFRPDIVLIDVSLPGRSAFEVKRWANEQQDLRNIRFVLMSSAFEKMDETQINEVQFQGRLTKPFDPANLRQVLNEVLGKEDNDPSLSFVNPQIGNEGFEMSNDLWENNKPQVAPPSLPDFETPMAPPPPPAIHHAADDIKELTENTIRLSGLDDFQWSINEPSLKPPSAMTDMNEGTMSIVPPPPPLAPLAPLSPSPIMNPLDSIHEDLEEDTHKIERPTDSTAIPISTIQMEEIIKKQIQETLEKMAQKILPEVAEKVIKQEIHRMLGERP